MTAIFFAFDVFLFLNCGIFEKKRPNLSIGKYQLSALSIFLHIDSKLKFSEIYGLFSPIVQNGSKE